MPGIQNFDFSHLSVDDRISLAQALWDSVYDEAPHLPLTQEMGQELDRRLAAEKAGEMEYFSWEDVKAELSKK